MKKIRIFLFILLIFAGGCATMPPEPPLPVHTPAEKEVTTLSIDVSHVKDRIGFLENLKRSKELSEDDRNTVLALLDTYRLLQKTGSGPVTGKGYDTLAQSLFRSMSLMENKYFEKIGKASGDENSFADFMERKNEILHLYLSKNYRGVIQRSLALRTRFPGGLTPEIGILLAISLAEDGMLSEAVDVGSEVTKELEGSPDVVQLRGDIARWQLALGRTADALKTLETITHTQNDRTAIISDLGNRIQEAPKEPGHPFQSMFQPPEGAAPQEVQPRLASLQEKVDALVRNHQFSEARQLLLKEKAEKEEGPETELLDRALKNIDETETNYEETVKAKAAYQKETYEAAGRLYEKEDYQEAIKTLAVLEKTQGLNDAARDLKDRATESHINRERNRAAEIFLEAKKTRDPGKKKELLETSYSILKTLVEDYPQSPLKNKLISHINIVQKELEKLR